MFQIEIALFWASVYNRFEFLRPRGSRPSSLFCQRRNPREKKQSKAADAARRLSILADTYDIWGNLNPDAPWAEMLSEDTQLPLWDGEVPGFEQAIGQRRPSITFFPAPGDGKRGCVIVMAGGSYTSKAVHEGKVVAQKINEAGIHAAVLDYRVVPYSRDIILLDAKRAVRYLRYHAEEMRSEEHTSELQSR